MGNPCFKSKNAKFFLYFDSVKITLEIMLNNFVEKKNFSCIKTKFLKVLKNGIFPPMLYVQKCQIFLLFRFGQNKTRNNA